MRTRSKSAQKALGSANSTRARNNGASRSNARVPTAQTITNGHEKAIGWVVHRRKPRQIKKAFFSKRERLRIKEQWLREEIRANRTLMLALFQWGLAVLVGMGTILYYVRRDVANNLALHHSLPPDGTVPPVRWFVGTAIMLMVSLIFCSMSKYLIKRQVTYRTQLIEMKPSFSGIIEGPTGGRINRYHYWLFLAFPFLDAVLWFYFRLACSFTIPW